MPGLAAPYMRNMPSERVLVTLIGAIQFVHILDFMMVMPLGPDFAAALGIPTHNIGLIGGSYTAAAAISALVSALFLDRFDRRSALLISIAGLVVCTVAGGFAYDERTLLLARLAAGLCAGPATALAIAIIADVVPVERRGRALGAVMGAFSVAAVVGVPIGLELARLGSWRLPFFAVGGLGLIVCLLALMTLPPLRAHLAATAALARKPHVFELFRRHEALVAYLMTALSMMAGFLIIPNLSTFVQFNLHYPREHLGLLYLVGGAVSFFALRVAGHFADRLGVVRVGFAGTTLLLVVLYAGFVESLVQFPVLLIFVSFMLAQSVRGVAMTTLNSQIPRAHERAGFMAINASVQHLGAAGGAILSTALLHAQADGSLSGMPTVATLAMVLATALPPLLWLVHNRLRL